MARIEFQNLAHAYRTSRTEARDARRLRAPADEHGVGRRRRVCVAGSVGLREVDLLNIVSGLVTPSEGRVLFDGRDVTNLSARERNIAQVFQFPVIYDTMSVFDNLAFPLRNRKLPAAEVKARVHEVAEILDMTRELGRKASNLSADAKQKISLGRGLVRKDVAAILFDEPLTVIDPHMKWILRRQLKKIHQQLKLTLIYVTHDQVEALTFADEVVVMTNGPRRAEGRTGGALPEPGSCVRRVLHRQPGNEPLPDRARCRWRDDRRAAPASRRNTLAALKGANGDLKLGIRPEFTRLSRWRSAGRGQGEAVARAEPRQLPARHRGLRRPRVQGEGRAACDAAPKARCGCSSPRPRPCSSATTKGSDDEAHQSEGVAAGRARVHLRRVLRDPAADDGGELFGAGHHQPDAACVRRHRMVSQHHQRFAICAARSAVR